MQVVQTMITFSIVYQLILQGALNQTNNKINFHVFKICFSTMFVKMVKVLIVTFKCFLTGLGSRSWSEQGVFGSLEPEPEHLKKNAGAAWRKSR